MRDHRHEQPKLTTHQYDAHRAKVERPEKVRRIKKLAKISRRKNRAS